MSGTQTVDSPMDESSELKTAIRECIAETDDILKQIQQDQTEIERSKMNTWAMLNDLKARGLC